MGGQMSMKRKMFFIKDLSGKIHKKKWEDVTTPPRKSKTNTRHRSGKYWQTIFSPCHPNSRCIVQWIASRWKNNRTIPWFCSNHPRTDDTPEKFAIIDTIERFPFAIRPVGPLSSATPFMTRFHDSPLWLPYLRFSIIPIIPNGWSNVNEKEDVFYGRSFCKNTQKKMGGYAPPKITVLRCRTRRCRE